jgi:hypothetical protein
VSQTIYLHDGSIVDKAETARLTESDAAGES